MGIEIGAFLINTALGIGAGLVGSWLSNKKQPDKTIAEDIPLLGQGNPLYGIWGLSFTPGSVLYATPPSLAGHDTEKSTYGVLAFSNPDSTAGLVGLRINNSIAASKTSILPIITQNGTNYTGSYANAIGGLVPIMNDPSLVTYPDGLRAKNDLSLIYQMATNVPNPNFSLNGYSGLQYEGLTWVGVNASPRSVYGGVNTRFVIYAKNRVTGGGTVPFTIKSDTPVNITTTLGFGTGKDNYTNQYPTTFPRGFFGTKKIVAFDADARYAIIGISGESEYVIHSYRPNNPAPSLIGSYSGSDVTSVKFSLTSSVVPGRPVPTPGFFPTTLSTSYVPALTTSLIIGERNGKLTEVTLSSPALPPFQSKAGVVKDSTNTVIFTAAGNQRCYGWAGQLFVEFTADGVSSDSTNLANILAPTAAVTGTSVSAFTNLSTIIQDLIKNKRPDRTLIDTSTLVNVGGFTSDYDNIDQTIIELCTAYGKVIFEDGDGDYHLMDYPAATPEETFTGKDFLEKPSIEYSPEFNQPSQIEFTYRAASDQLTEKVIHIGYSNRFGSTANVKYNLTLDESEARRLAWNVLFLRSHTNMKLTFRSNKGIASAGKVISYDGELYLVGNIEIGQDMSFRYTCVNYVPLSTGYTDYMLNGSSLPINPQQQQPVLVKSFVLATETRAGIGDATRMGSFYTNSSSVAYVRRNDGNLVNLKACTPTSGGFTGQVGQFTMKTGDFVHGYDTITMVRTAGTNYGLPAGQVIRVGQSWVKFGSFNSTGSTFILSDLDVGLYGSSPIIRGGDWVIDFSVTNELAGYDRISLPLTEQNSTVNYMKSLPEPLINGTAPLFGVPTGNFPHGFPVSGAVPGQVMASSYGGVLRIWTSKPGNKPGFFFLNDMSDGTDYATTHYYFQSGLSFLYDLEIPVAQPYVVNTVAGIPVGSFLVYQARVGHTVASPLLNSVGSFTFTGGSF